MKKHSFLFLISILVIISAVFTMMSCSSSKAVETYSYSTTFSEVNWREGMVGGNGHTGFITNGSPKSDVITYQNIDYLMPTNANRDDIPTASTSLDDLRQKIVNFQKPTGGDHIDRWQRIAKYHPGMQLRIDTVYANEVTGYERFTNYETAEVGEKYSDGSIKWERTTFTSRVDNATITSITNSKKDVTITVSIDTISKMTGFGAGKDGDQKDETNIQYKELVADDATYLAQVAHYPDYENSSLKNGGFVAVTYVIVDGGEKTAKKINTTDSYNKSGYDAAIEIKNAKAVYLITALDRTKEMGTMSAFASQDSYALMDTLYNQVVSIADKYGNFSYKKALAPSAKEHKALFEAASINVTKNEDATPNLSNNELIANQRDSKTTTLSSTLSNRVYNQGRYAMICCAGYSMSRLSGMWIGTWDPGWRYIYTMDANVNLQSSGMNTSNISSFGEGYIRFVYNQLEDWEKNAKAIYNIDDAILCPPHADGDRAINDEGNIGYPFQYWNAGAAWMIQPIYEFYQCYGNRTISTADGDLKLVEDILIPMLEKNANFWMGLCTPKYYTDANGNACYDANKTSLTGKEKYLIIPSYSPENETTGSYKSTLAANGAMDISSAKYSLQMAIELENLVKASGYADKVKAYEDFLALLPEYQFNSDGSIKEWCANGYNDNNAHRHISHLYLAWPAFETQGNEKLLNATKQAITNRDKAGDGSQTKQGHFWLHKGLVAARIKDAEYTTNVLYTMLHKKHITQTGLLYNSLMTNHDITGESNAYCTDSSFGIVGVINECLLYSNTGVIELLPACPTTWKVGSFTTLRARTQADVSCTWTETQVKYTIKSDIDQTITIKCGTESKEVTVKAGKTIKGTMNR